MLSNLHIENIAVIESANIEFEKGLNVITGETGAGKSVVIGAIGAVLGNRVSKDYIRYGTEYGLVSAVFTGLTEKNISFIRLLGYECEDESILIHREFNLNGKNKCKINGRPATVSILRSIGKELIDVYGQNESYSLCDPGTHINYIDSFGNLSFDISNYQKIYGELVQLCKRIELLDKNNKDNIGRADMLRYQVNELESAELLNGEIEELNKQREICANTEKIKNSINQVYFILNGEDTSLGALQGIEKSIELITSIMEYSKNLESIYNRLSTSFYEIQECLMELQSLNNRFEYDDFELERVEQRLDLLYKLSRKYGGSTDEMLKYLEKARNELDELEAGDGLRDNLSNDYEDLEIKVKKLADKISYKRREASKIFIKKVSEELHFLDMPNIQVNVDIEKCGLTKLGADKLEIIASLNKGDIFKPISKIASGGELSRIMLGIKNVLCDDMGISTLIFDEVDAGVSGSAAQKIGMKLKELSRGRQVICITHLAQIACLGDSHFLIKKLVENASTATKVKKLELNERCKEIARIIEGTNVSEITLKNAEEMLRRAHILK